MTADGSGMSRLVIAVTVAGALIAGSCARGDTLGAEAAIEVMVLEGVDRGRATCVVRGLDGQLDLEKVAGIDVDLDDEELVMLAAATSACAPVLGDIGGVIGGDTLDPVSALAGQPDPDHRSAVEAMVDELVLGGLAANVGDCLVEEILASDDPAAALEGDEVLVGLLLDCDAASG